MSSCSCAFVGPAKAYKCKASHRVGQPILCNLLLRLHHGSLTSLYIFNLSRFTKLRSFWCFLMLSFLFFKLLYKKMQWQALCVALPWQVIVFALIRVISALFLKVSWRPEFIFESLNHFSLSKLSEPKPPCCEKKIGKKMKEVDLHYLTHLDTFASRSPKLPRIHWMLRRVMQIWLSWTWGNGEKCILLWPGSFWTPSAWPDLFQMLSPFTSFTLLRAFQVQSFSKTERMYENAFRMSDLLGHFMGMIRDWCSVFLAHWSRFQV